MKCSHCEETLKKNQKATVCKLGAPCASYGSHAICEPCRVRLSADAPKEPIMEHDQYMRVVSMTAESAMAFVGSDQTPVDLGPPLRTERYKDGARVWGFKAGDLKPRKIP